MKTTQVVLGAWGMKYDPCYVVIILSTIIKMIAIQNNQDSMESKVVFVSC